MGELYWGDNLTILRDHIASDSIDLIYLDPPFNSNRNYNVLFKEQNRHESDAQIEAFTDTWHWGDIAEATYNELVTANHVPQKVSDLVVALRSFIGSNDVMAYLVMMTIRLLELHRVLKPTGSIYLHCDPTASHYLKVVMDTIWGPENFRNEIIWKRTSAHSSSNKFGPVHDVVLFYSESDRGVWNTQYRPYTEEYLDDKYRHRDADGRRYQLDNLTAAGVRHGSSGKPWRGIDPTARGYHWKFTIEKLDELDGSGRIYWPAKGSIPRYKRFLDEVHGIALQDVWDDISPINSQGAERLGYPTQKPLALLERIVNASSNPGDVVLDSFCGCGTAIAAAEKLGRQWVGIDITHLAVTLIVSRMRSMFPDVEIHLHGEPADVGGAFALANQDRYDFQYWALTLVGARPSELKDGKGKKGADRGIDGIISFIGADSKTPHRCIVQVKSGHVSSATIRDLKGTVEREKAELGLLITLEEPSGPMKVEALEAGYYHSDWMQRDYPRIQIVTIGELLHGTQPAIPIRYNPYQLAEQARRLGQSQQAELFSTGS